MFGLVGGPLNILSGTLAMFGVTPIQARSPRIAPGM
jgi:hypothetical protein